MWIHYPSGTRVYIRPDELPALEAQGYLSLLKKPEWYTPEKVAELIGVNVRTVLNWIGTEILPASRISDKLVRVSCSDLILFMLAFRHPAAASSSLSEQEEWSDRQEEALNILAATTLASQNTEGEQQV